MKKYLRDSKTRTTSVMETLKYIVPFCGKMFIYMSRWLGKIQ